jgi:hypothetical protein
MKEGRRHRPFLQSLMELLAAGTRHRGYEHVIQCGGLIEIVAWPHKQDYEPQPASPGTTCQVEQVSGHEPWDIRDDHTRPVLAREY